MNREKYEFCLKITEEALRGMKVAKKCRASESYLGFIGDYVADAKHYAEKGDYATALEAIAYAHGFVDAGVLSGYFKIEDYHLGCL